MSKTWFITGASTGFGRSLTEKLLARGDRVAATSRNARALDGLIERYGDRLWVAALDVRDPQAVRKTLARAFAELGRIDTIVSNAGYGVLGAAEETTDTQLRDIVETNLIGSIVLIRSALPYLREQGGGRVLQVSSEGGQIAYPGFSLYHATKWGIEGFVETLAKELVTFGIRFTLVEPGPARTDFGRSLVYPEPIAAYDATPAHQTRDALLSGDWVIAGDPERMTDAMIAVADQPDPPLRLVLGGTSYHAVRDALSARLDELEAQRETAFSTDYPEEELV
ncbi:short-chain dehydrogenase/reductase [Alkalilimnicola ehrlichii]|uniref:Short-chain dehydrogenase/reductase n=1 Tax=Alkalilimnicola ehrlichii TaxID=351052 RepID=A0A3E0X0Y8_9GAMM|nr:SDR family oxidoreductase [Alkalilimnicola ehrlichii]RFA30986.1 short-chain dehydrogenase/reductase [Alkalilimnicola ehrlichii]RFA38938.1 short-chain dehydrogenase/reductase [Alkalilimnicola ehrlichii]